MIRGPLPAELDDAILSAAREHQRVDRFTDMHQSFRRTRQRLSLIVDARLSGVLADVLYDHVLARDWVRWREDGFEDFVSGAERHLLEGLVCVPSQMQVIVRRMIQEQWLASYATPAGVRARLDTMSDRLSRRLGRSLSLLISEKQLADEYPLLAMDFAEFWPDLLTYVKRSRQ